MVSIAPSTPPRSLIASNSLLHGFFHQVGEGVDDVAALPRVLVEVEAEFLVGDHLDRHRTAHRKPERRKLKPVLVCLKA